RPADRASGCARKCVSTTPMLCGTMPRKTQQRPAPRSRIPAVSVATSTDRILACRSSTGGNRCCAAGLSGSAAQEVQYAIVECLLHLHVAEVSGIEGRQAGSFNLPLKESRMLGRRDRIASATDDQR